MENVLLSDFNAVVKVFCVGSPAALWFITDWFSRVKATVVK